MKMNSFVAVVFLAFADYCASMPFHAQCLVTWNFDSNCSYILTNLVSQIKLWSGPENCKQGGEKCLYKLETVNKTQITATHTTPKSRYIDDLTFTFSTGSKCILKGISRSQKWYAVLDFGTNYCNLENLVIGSKLNRVKGYKEITSDSQCTQYSSANCEKY